MKMTVFISSFSKNLTTKFQIHLAKHLFVVGFSGNNLYMETTKEHAQYVADALKITPPVVADDGVHNLTVPCQSLFTMAGQQVHDVTLVARSHGWVSCTENPYQDAVDYLTSIDRVY